MSEHKITDNITLIYDDSGYIEPANMEIRIGKDLFDWKNAPADARVTVVESSVYLELKDRIEAESTFEEELDEYESLENQEFNKMEAEKKVETVKAEIVEQAKPEKKMDWSTPGKKLAEKKTRAMAARRVPQTVTKFTQDQITTIKNTVAKGASQSEFEMFMYLCDKYQLDPFLKEIFYASNMHTIMTSRDGYLKIAQRDPDYDGMQSMAVCEGDEFELDVPNSTVVHKFKGKRGAVIGAWAIAYRKGRRPVVAYAPYEEYVKKTDAWRYKSAMCCKCAETQVLKRQYGISGLVTVEEIGVSKADEEIIDAEYSEAE